MAIKLVSALSTPQFIQFQNSSGQNTGKIETSGNDLIITNAVGDVLFGDGASDIYIGDGVNNVDIIFEQSGAIRAENGSSATITLGSAGTTLNLYNPQIANGASLTSALSIGAGGVIDFLPDTGAIINLDGQTILKRNTFNGGITLGHDDAVIIAGGDTYNTLESNISLGAETVFLGAEGGVIMYAFPDNDTSWSNRKEFIFSNDTNFYLDGRVYPSDQATNYVDSTSISNWNQAYSWGDHSDGGYLTSFDITTQTDSKYLRSNTSDTFGNANSVLTIEGTVRSNNNSNANGPNFNVSTTNKAIEEYAYRVDRSGTVVGGIRIDGNISIPDYIFHTGDTNTYMQFHAADQWRVVTAGGERLEVNNSQVTVANNLVVGGDTTTGKITISKESQHVTQGSISASNAFLDLYNNWESDTDQKGSIITFTDNYYDGSNYNKTTRAAIKGGTDTVGNTADGYLEFYTDSAGANSPGLALRLDKNQNATFSGTITATGGNSTNWNTAYSWGNHGSAGYLTTASAASTYAPLASPALTGTPTAPTAAAATNTTQIATTAFVKTAVSNLIDSAPGTLDTLNELAAALGDDANFSTTMTTALGNRLRIDTNAQGLNATQQANGRTNLGLGTAATSALTDFVSVNGGTIGGNLDIVHASNATGLTVRVSGGANPTIPQFKVGRDGSQYFGVFTTDRDSYLIHRQDETTGGCNMHFQMWSSSPDSKDFLWEDASNVGSGVTQRMKLTESSELTLGGGSNTITNTKVGNWDTAYGWGDHSTEGYLTSETFGSSDVVMSLSGNDIIAGTSVTLAGGLSYNASTNTLSQTDNNTVYTHPTFNGDDFSIDTGALTGATVISDLDINITTNSEGHVTDANATVATRNLTAANIGAAASSHNHAAGDITSGTFAAARIPSLDASKITSGTLNTARLPTPVSGDWWNGGAAVVGNDGVMEIGKYIDFHDSDTETSDFSYRMTATDSNMAFSGNVGITGNLTGVNDLYVADQIIHTNDTNTYIQFHANDQWRVVTGGSERFEVTSSQTTVQNTLYAASNLNTSNITNVNYGNIGTTANGTVVRGGFLNPASEGNMVHLPHNVNDLAGFNHWGTITVSGLYKTRSGTSGSYTYSNAVATSDFNNGAAFDSYSSTAGSWYSDNGTDGIYQEGSDTPGVITLEWTNELTYSAWVGIVFGSGSFTATKVKIEAYRGGAWQTLCDLTNNTSNVVLRQIGSNGGTNSATTKLRYTLGGSVNNSYFRIHTLYAANYRAGDNNISGISTDVTRGVHFLEKYKTNYTWGSFIPATDSSYTLGNSGRYWTGVYSDKLYLNGTDTNTSSTTALVLNGTEVEKRTLGSLAFSSATYDNYGSWNLKTNDVQRTTVGSGDDLNLVAGTNVSLSYSAGGTVTITSTDTNTQLTDAQVRSKISGTGLISYNSSTGVISTTANNYSLPAGSSSTRGGFKIGYAENGKNYPVEVTSEKMYVNVPWTDTNTNTVTSVGVSGSETTGTITLTAAGATTLTQSGQTIEIRSTDTNTTYTVGDGGLTQKNFTTTLKSKLDGIAANANNYSLPANIPATSVAIGSTVTLSESTDRADLLYINSSTSTWGGLQIGNTSNEFIFSLMGDGNVGGIYDDVNADWIIYWTENGGVELLHNAGVKLATTSTGITITGEIVTTGGNSTNWNTAYGWGNHSTQGYATQTYVNTAVSNLVSSAPAALDTLNELAAALGDDANFSTTMTTALGNRLRIDTNAQGLTSTQKSNGRTNLGLGTLATLSTVNAATITNNSVGAAELNVSGNGSSGQVLTSDGDGTMTWTSKTANTDTITSVGVSGSETAGVITLTGAGATTITQSGGGIEIRSTDTNTTYSVGDGGLTQKNFTTTLKTKLDGIAAGANNYVHPTTAGNKHIPAGGSAGQFLKYSASGTAVWAADNNTTYSVGDNGLTQKNFTSTLKTKLDGIAANANNYSLPVASAAVSGGIKVGTNLSISSGVLSATNTTYSAGTGLTLSGTTFKLKGGEIPASADLNHSSYRATGVYSQNSNSDASSGSNYPVALAGMLEVWNDDYGNGLHCLQRYSQYNSTDVYQRNYYNGSWSVWRNLTQDTNTTYSVGDNGLTQKNFTSTLKTKLDGIASGAEVNVQSNWNATSGDALILNKPTIPTNNNQLTNGAGYVTSSGVTSVTVGTGLDVTTGATPNITLDLSEFTDMTQTMVGTDEFIVLDSGAERRKAANEINLSIFNNDLSYLPDVTPVAPVVSATNIVGETIEVVFGESSTPNIDYYQVWSSVDGGSYGLISQIPDTDFASVMTVIDASFSVSGTIAYRVYAVKSGVYSAPGTASKAFATPTLDVSNMSVVNLNTAYYIQYDLPDSRFVDHIEIYMDSEANQANLTRTGATLIYSGDNTSYMYSVGTNNNYHQFWVEVIES